MEAKSKTRKLGTSLPVPCVKEITAEQLTSVPSRYVRPDLVPQISDSASLPRVPVIDMHNLYTTATTHQDSMNSELEKLHHACKDWGFFQVINHGVSSLLVEKVKMGIKELFNMPMEEKKRYWQEEGDLEGFGQAFVVSEEQKLDWGDMFYMLTLPLHLRKPHLFPNLPLPFRDNLEAYSAEVERLARKIIDLIAKNLRIEADYIKELFEGGHQSMRMNYYPPCPQPEHVIGLSAHSDAVGLTVLLQINEMEGLQIKKDGIWVPINPIPDAFIINIGDILEIITNGNYRSIEHRATVNKEKERLSIATFYSPRLDGEIGPAPNLSEPLFERIGVEEYLRRLFSTKLDGKRFLDAMRIHPTN